MRRALRRRTALLFAGLLPAAALLSGIPDAGAMTGTAATPETLPATPGAMWQTNDAVWALAYNNGVVWAAGEFTAIRPPGTAAGDAQEIPMQRLAAFNATGPNAGKPCTAAWPCPGIGAWQDPKISAKVWALSVTPDGSRIYAGGEFTYVNNVARARAVGFDLTKTGATSAQMQLPWNPGANGTVRAIASTNDNVYLGGAFTSVKDASGAVVAQPRAASWATATNALRTDWTPTIDAAVYALMVGPGADSGNLVLGGTFRTVNGAPHSGIAQVDQATGDVNGPMSNAIIPSPADGNRSDVKVLTTDGTDIYVGAEGTGYGWFDGQASVNALTGELNWKSNCLGATQALALIGNALYIGSHSHDCSRLPTGGFPQRPFANDSSSWHHLLAEQARADGTPNSGGRLLTWYPTVNAGPTNGATANEIGPRAMATDGTHLWVGGQFTQVNGVDQRGITTFAPGPDTTAPATIRITGTSPAPGKVTVRWTGSSDPDDTTLSYSITRDGAPLTGATTPGTATPVASPWWQSPVYTYRDTAVPAGPHTYQVTVTDADGLVRRNSVTVDVAAAATGGYKSSVLLDKPSVYWRLDETGGTTAKDSSGNNATGTLRGAPTLNRPGAIDANKAIRLNNNTSSGVSPTTAPALPPANYSLEAWIRVDPTNRNGGRLIGWSNTATTKSTAPDRTLYMMNSGQLVYSIFTKDGKTCRATNRYMVGGTCYVWTLPSYNDGTWHHVVATQSSTTGMALYVDGLKVASTTETSSFTPKVATKGVWRVGADNLAPFPNVPFNLNGPVVGDVDEVAVYPYTLTPERIAAHRAAAE